MRTYVNEDLFVSAKNACAYALGVQQREQGHEPDLKPKTLVDLKRLVEERIP